MTEPQWCVVLFGRHTDDDPEVYGPFVTEDDCYTFAARVSQKPNDWLPTSIRPPDEA